MFGALTAFAVASVLIVLLPGPDTLVVLRSLIRGGRRAATATALGVLSGLLVWVVGAVLGLSALLRASHDGYTALRVAGGVYLVWLGVQSLRARTSPLDPAAAPRRSLLGTGYVAGLATDLLNPKVGVFFVTFLPAFVPHGRSVGTTTAALGATFIVETALYFAVLIRLAGRITAWMADARTRRRLDRGTGAVLLGLGLRLAAEP
jgi:threonine/homoserine/homoserine lactone efflux protein